MNHVHAMPFGASVLDAGVRFSYWAPDAERIGLERGEQPPVPMQRTADGWHRLDVPQARAGERYRFCLPDGTRVPDPASRRNPVDVHGASEVIDPQAYAWHDDEWRGRPWTEAVIYELHIGAFTPEGTFAAARKRLVDLATLGITVVELMPVAASPGHQGWGYDGVLLFAPDACYGTPDELKAFVNAAHDLGLMVLLDVVYNHFGPEGNYLHAGSPHFFNAAHQTPWGAAINYDGEEARTVRDFFVHNALFWVEEYRFDGLRMDAVHAIRDDSRPDIVEEICTALRDGPGRERQVHIVLENDANGARYLARDAAGQPRIATAQWNDDLHHAAHVLVSGDTDGYYADYTDDPIGHFGRALAEGFVFQGQASRFRDGEMRGEPSTHLPSNAFVSFLQTHDQVGNRAFGDRIDALADPALLRAAYACLLLSPHVPMLFMGEEYAASTPFLYFCDFGHELAAAVSDGRRAEFGKFAAFTDEAARARIPDPNAASTFEASKLNWQERLHGPHRDFLAFISELLAIRRRLVTPHLANQRGGGQYWREGEVLRVDWSLGSARLRLLANFGRKPLTGIQPLAGSPIYATGLAPAGNNNETLRLAPGAVCVTLQENNHG
ncbi:malto-oligosyltrehalose trehalohydrolase [Variovorax sp. dw_954]|uniref:malto-oligosyltrehalose trehalohydrolase n=1 Tax=Variovorax sp. dw_954 TaxID=2720078 RepID=UPI001BD38C41|nr:malto-oligosyltrehalose trehalohydrolase [Variovorax sp. dw_954]